MQDLFEELQRELTPKKKDIAEELMRKVEEEFKALRGEEDDKKEEDDEKTIARNKEITELKGAIAEYNNLLSKIKNIKNTKARDMNLQQSKHRLALKQRIKTCEARLEQLKIEEEGAKNL